MLLCYPTSESDLQVAIVALCCFLGDADETFDGVACDLPFGAIC